MEEEFAANRLGWNVEDLKRIIMPYPKSKQVDAILANIQDDTWIPEGECAYEQEGEEASDDAEDEESADEENEEDEEAADLAALVEISGHDVRSSEHGDVEDFRSGGEAPSIASATEADALTRSQTLISVFEAVMESLKEVGAQGAVAHMANEIQKERRRARAIGKEDPDVLFALARQRDQEEAQERRRRLLLSEDKKRALTAANIYEEAKATNERLKKRKQELAHLEDVLEAKHSIKTCSLEDSGKGRSRGGAAAARKRRLHVLDRLARLGQGLSPAQRNDFSWWKDAWDATMCQQHGGYWPEVFAGWVQRLLEENEAGAGNVFSLFVHAETRRCFDGVPGLRVP